MFLAWTFGRLVFCWAREQTLLEAQLCGCKAVVTAEVCTCTVSLFLISFPRQSHLSNSSGALLEVSHFREPGCQANTKEARQPLPEVSRAGRG